MTARQPFTTLCRQLAGPRWAGRADLHIHSTFSDGAYTPAEIVNLARRSGLAAVALTDHDTIDGILPARQAAGSSLEVVAGVELTTEYQGANVHLLGYFFRLDDPDLAAALARLRQARAERFGQMLDRLENMGVKLNAASAADQRTLGRRHLAQLLVDNGKVGSIREAFVRYLGDHGRVTVPHAALPLAEAIQTVRGAGGVAALAHPSYDCTREHLQTLAALGLQAVEVNFPSCRPGRARELRAWAREFGLAITGGSDCHGPGASELGRESIELKDLEVIRGMASDISRAG